MSITQDSPTAAGSGASASQSFKASLAGQVVRSLDRALGAVLSPGGHLLDGVFYENVEDQRPLAGLAHLDHPGLGGLVFRVGDVVLADGLMDAVKDCGNDGGDPFGRCGGGQLSCR